MSEDHSEEFKLNGNQAFSEKRFEDAVILYGKAIGINPHNFVYYNNRSAANYELKNYENAIEDAKKSLAIENNAKAHIRIASVLWAQGKLKESKHEFELALSLDSNNDTVKDNITNLTNLMNLQSTFHQTTQGPASAFFTSPPLYGEFTPSATGIFGVIIDLMLCINGVMLIFSYIFSPSQTSFLWTYFLFLTIAQQSAITYYKGFLPRSMDDIGKLLKITSAILLLICLLALINRISPQLFMVAFITLYTVVDLTSHQTDLAKWMGPLYNIFSVYLQKAETARDHLLLVAASFEAITSFTIVFSGGTFFTLAYMQYIKNRYNSDRYIQLAFSSLRPPLRIS